MQNKIKKDNLDGIDGICCAEMESFCLICSKSIISIICLLCFRLILESCKMENKFVSQIKNAEKLIMRFRSASAYYKWILPVMTLNSKTWVVIRSSSLESNIQWKCHLSVAMIFTSITPSSDVHWWVWTAPCCLGASSNTVSALRFGAWVQEFMLGLCAEGALQIEFPLPR